MGRRPQAVAPESAIAVLLVDGALVAGVGNPSLGLPVPASSLAAGMLLFLSLGSALWALAGLLVRTAKSIRRAAQLLACAVIVLTASVVADLLVRLSPGPTVFAIVAIAGAAALPIVCPKAVAWALPDIVRGADGQNARSTSKGHLIVRRPESGRPGHTDPREVAAGSAELAGRTAGAAIVGAVAGCLSVADRLRDLHGGLRIEVVSISLADPAFPSTAPNPMPTPANSGFVRASL